MSGLPMSAYNYDFFCGNLYFLFSYFLWLFCRYWYIIYSSQGKEVAIMGYLTVKDIAQKWEISERSVRNYCQNGRITGAFLIGKTWSIPDNANKPSRKPRKSQLPRTLYHVLKTEKSLGMTGGIYHKLQIELTYNSNHIEGSKLTHDETRYIYETNTIGINNKQVNVDDIIETVNHFRCIDYVIDHYNKTITEKMLKDLHQILKTGTSDNRQFCRW